MTTAAARDFASPLGSAAQECVAQAVALGALQKSWFRKDVGDGGDGQRRYVIQLTCKGDVARKLWVQLGKIDVVDTPFTQDHSSGFGRYLGDRSHCQHLTKDAKGEPMSDFSCRIMLDLTPEIVTAF